MFFDMLIKFIYASVISGTPLLLGTTGEILNEKVGHLNLGVEGMMSIGACTGFMIGYYTDSFILALLGAAAGGMLAALIYAVLTIHFMTNQNVTGLTLTIFGIGLSNMIGVYNLSRSVTGTLKLPEHITAMLANIDIPFLSDIPVVGNLVFSYNPFVYIAIIIAIIAHIYLYKTNQGLKVRSVGENPATADAVGINVNRVKMINILIGGAICGLGGAYCSMIINGGVWINDNVAGLGWIAGALVIFANWKPAMAALGSFLFGALRILKYYIPKSVIDIPIAFYDMLPFLMTAVVLVIISARKSSQKKSQLPAYLGLNYFREDR